MLLSEGRNTKVSGFGEKVYSNYYTLFLQYMRLICKFMLPLHYDDPVFSCVI